MLQGQLQMELDRSTRAAHHALRLNVYFWFCSHGAANTRANNVVYFIIIKCNTVYSTTGNSTYGTDIRTRDGVLTMRDI